MMKKILLITLIIIFSLGFSVEGILALNSPINPHTISVGEGLAILGWTWPPPEGEGTGTARRFILSFKIQEENEWIKRYPDISGGPDYVYQLVPLDENTTYEWTIMVEAVNPNNNSGENDPPADFTTEAGAVENGGNGGGLPIELTNPLAAESLAEAIDALINFLLFLAFAVAPILLIYAGFLLIFNRGDTASIAKAKKIILWTMVALAIMLFAKGLPSVVKGVLGA